jgi:hypothetical protein
MFQFTGLPSTALFYSGRDTRALPRVGFPIRTSRDQRMVSSFPGLFAAAHVLLRLLAPRHPPCALSLLIMKNTVVAAMEFSRCTRPLAPNRKPSQQGRSLKTQQREIGRRGRRNSRRPEYPDGHCRKRQHWPSTGSGASGVIAPDSLERR